MFSWKRLFLGIGIAICLLVLFSIGFFYYLFFNPYWNDILYRSYISTQYDCNPNFNFKESAPEYSLAGTYNISSNEIKIYKSDEDNSIKKHEQVHRIQYFNGRAYSCSYQILVYFNELEAYYAESMPDNLFIKKYGKF